MWELIHWHLVQTSLMPHSPPPTSASLSAPQLCVACVPKSIANEMGIIDRSFGFETAVEVGNDANSRRAPPFC